MFKKISIILFFTATVGARHAVPLQGLPLLSDTAFADIYTQDGKPCPPECVSDSMEIETWYPSPYNEYEELRLYPISVSNSQCNSDTRGLMYYDSEEDKVKLCKGPAGSNDWQELAGGGWEVSGNNIYNTNSGNVGIGTTNPGVSKLYVKGLATFEIPNAVSDIPGNPDSYGVSISNQWDSTMVIRSLGSGVMHIATDVSGREIRLGGGAFEQTLTIKSGGNIGIGTTNPQYKLDVGGGTIGNAKINQGGCYWTPWADWSNGPQICAAGYYVAGQNQKDCGNWHDCESLYCCHP